MKYHKKLIHVAVLSAFVGFSGAASAGFVSSAVDAAGSTISAAVTKLQASLMLFLQAESAQQHADIEKGNAIKKTIAEASVDAQLKERMKENALELSNQVADNGASTCKGVLMGSSLANSVETTDAALSNLSLQQKDRTMNTASTSAVIAKTIKDHDKYCSQHDAQRNRCSSNGAVALEEQDLDLKANNILAPNENQTYTPKQLEAAKVYANGLINPFPTTELPAGYEKSPQGKAFVVAKRVEQQLLSLAFESMNQIIAIRTPNSDLGSSLKNIINLDNPSQLAIIQKVANNYNDSNWHKTVMTSNDTQLLKENVKQNAFKSLMDYNAFLQMERIEGLLAATLALEAKESSQALLNAQRSSAARASGNSTQ